LLATESTRTDVLSIRTTDREWGAAVALSGRITIDSSPELRACLLQILNRKALSMMLIDVAAVRHRSSQRLPGSEPFSVNVPQR
jgi:anti-anti-sigma regulatory factor